MAIREAEEPAPVALLGTSLEYISNQGVAFTVDTGVNLSNDGGIVLSQVSTGGSPNLFSKNSLNPGLQYWNLNNGSVSRPTAALDAITNFGNGTLSIGTNSTVNSAAQRFITTIWDDAPGFFKHVRQPAPEGAAGYTTVQHNLGVDPAMVWVRTEQLPGGENPPRVFRCFLRFAGDDSNDRYFDLNSSNDGVGQTEVFGTDADFADTSTQFYLRNNNGDLNQGTSSFTNSYVFGADGDSAASGVLSSTSTANDFSGGTVHTVNLGWRPSFVLCKAVNGAVDENFGLSRDWNYWTTDSQSDGLTATRRNLAFNTNGFIQGYGAILTDTGFQIRVHAGSPGSTNEFFYYAVREGAADASVLPDFDLYNLDGTSVELSEAGRTAIASGRGNEAAVRTAINAATTSGVTYTAGGTGNDIDITQDVWAGSSNLTHEVINSDATFSSVVDNTSFERTQANPSYRSGAVGYEEMLVNLGTSENLDSEVTIDMGNGSPGVQIFADVDNTGEFAAAIGQASQYVIQAPNDISSTITVGDGVDTVAETIALLVSRINDHLVGGDPSYEAAAGTGNTIVLTEDDREAVAYTLGYQG